MPLHHFLGGASFDDEAVRAMTIAFDDTLRDLRLTDRNDPLVETVAKAIMDCARKGDRDPAAMRKCALQALRKCRVAAYPARQRACNAAELIAAHSVIHA